MDVDARPFRGGVWRRCPPGLNIQARNEKAARRPPFR
jgi:hypothetical protein